MSASAVRLALGTVQLGQTYGVANKSGQVGGKEAAGIIAAARAAGLDTLDTAAAYGVSEARLGEIGVGGWKVVTKLPPFPAGESDATGWVRRSLSGSLERLRVRSVHGLLLHRSADLGGKDGGAIYAAMAEGKRKGLCAKIGVSIYDPLELDAINGRFEVNIVQAPFNALDRRLARSGWLARLHSARVEVHARSAFLQGLLLMRAAERPLAFSRWEGKLRSWDEWTAAAGLTSVEAALRFVLSVPEIDRVVVGVDDARQLAEILAAAAGAPISAPEDLASDDEDLINPSRWGSV